MDPNYYSDSYDSSASAYMDTDENHLLLLGQSRHFVVPASSNTECGYFNVPTNSMDIHMPANMLSNYMSYDTQERTWRRSGCAPRKWPQYPSEDGWHAHSEPMDIDSDNSVQDSRHIIYRQIEETAPFLGPRATWAAQQASAADALGITPKSKKAMFAGMRTLECNPHTIFFPSSAITGGQFTLNEIVGRK